jgi:hypothetical protein
LERGPSEWLDRDWCWNGLDAADQLAFKVLPEWLVVADEVEADAQHDLLGVLVTTGPIAPSHAALDPAVVGSARMMWVEYIAIAPSVRDECPEQDRRGMVLKGVGQQLMLAAILRSERMGCDGRIGLHAEGDKAIHTYRERWKMHELPEAPHPTGGSFPIFFGSAEWAQEFRSKVRR